MGQFKVVALIEQVHLHGLALDQMTNGLGAQRGNPVEAFFLLQRIDLGLADTISYFSFQTPGARLPKLHLPAFSVSHRSSVHPRYYNAQPLSG